MHGRFRATRQAQVIQRHLIDREEATGRTVLRRHVGEGGAVGQRQLGQAVAIKFHELAHHAFLAQHLGDRQDKVGGGDAFAQLTGELEADHLWDQHRHRLAKHGGLRLDAAHTPAQHAKAIDHGGVGVGADQGVREGIGAPVGFAGPHGAPQVFEVHLVADASSGRYHTEIIEGALAPTQERVALPVALHLDVDVFAEGLRCTVAINHHGVVDHQVNGRERVDALGVAARFGHGRAHGGEVHHRRYAGEVLHQYPRRAVLDFAV